MSTEKNVVIFINAMRPETPKAIREYESRTKSTIQPIILVDESVSEAIYSANHQDEIPSEIPRITCNFDSKKDVEVALSEYLPKILSITAQFENCVDELSKIVDYFPGLKLPTKDALIASTDKSVMRNTMQKSIPELIPGFREIDANYTETEIDEIAESLEFPLIVKPNGLGASLLVSKVVDIEELKSAVKLAFSEIENIYDKWVKRQLPSLLIEEFMGGELYSLDVYVNSRGKKYYTPVVRVYTGADVGYEDYFGYAHSTPSGLSELQIEKARETAGAACDAVGLMSATGHVEMIKTNTGWKIVELGPRIGGFRHELYSTAFEINHIVNDFLIRADIEPEIPTECKKFASYVYYYNRKEGKVVDISGLNMLKELSSLILIKRGIYTGGQTVFAKHGGDPMFFMFFANEDIDALNEDIAKMQRELEVTVDPKAAI